jgi:hypothetical protein
MSTDNPNHGTCEANSSMFEIPEEFLNLDPQNVVEIDGL